MGLKLFFKEHLSFIIFELIVVLFILSLYWLDGFRNVDTAVYSIVISMILIFSFLAVRFAFRRNFLQRISNLPQTMDDALQKNAKTPEHLQTEAYLQELYRLYQNEVQNLYAKQDRQEKFLNQWIHQMKTPISVLELLLQEEEIDRTSIQEEVDRLKRGIEMVLMNARIEKFEEDMQIDEVRLKEIVTATINDNKRLFITNHVFPVIDIDPEVTVTTDSKWLKFMFTQFITNAVKYTFEPNKKVKIFVEKNESKTVLCVEDEGIGIPKSDLARVTKPFFTGENGRRTGESTGMGLYLAKEICEKLGHRLEIESEVGKGTLVKVIF
ncbi:sensor histidine kinase [Ureibacillus sp. FSL K6-8385]|uniref:histidine kinase n=1 Tax=Ureibacillus terrenus TaxID=118246 RepID=A0A540V1Z2_9BACL|nr:sensor histidine kinase [Ureibacillus terrenus]MED3661037.1 sensor histidine kinase [Ureibacillus terrenus]MED3763323.1 sensor histidine kinase [Ureibacillus terrenus]TQE90738.1 HAMP domain-containing histidine kinase [Ureibacillus terrenus]